MRSLVRISAFLRKEIVEVIRQPVLVMLLVVGPFSIMLLFGLGYHQSPSMRTLFVVPEESPLAEQIRSNPESLGPNIDFRGVSTDEENARRALRTGRVEAVVVAPEEPVEMVRSGDQATFEVYHDELDPFRADYINFVAQSAVDELNRQVLASVVEEGQGGLPSVEAAISGSRSAIEAAREAEARDDTGGSEQQRRVLRRNIDTVTAVLGVTTALIGGISELEPDSEPGELAQALSDLEQRAASLEEPGADRGEDLAAIEEDLEVVESSLSDLEQIDPEVLARPFRAESSALSGRSLSMTHFFGPGVFALLLQHLAITFAGLSLVRERQLGIRELFRVAPLTPAETLIGKGLAFMAMGGVVAASLLGLLVLVLGVPMAGDWMSLVAAVATLIFASLALGFLVSALAHTDLQAVQYAMLVLLVSIFFSGFFLNLDFLRMPVRLISYALPATHAIEMLQDVMLRGRPAEPDVLTVLAGIGLVSFLAAWLTLRTRMALR